MCAYYDKYGLVTTTDSQGKLCHESLWEWGWDTGSLAQDQEYESWDTLGQVVAVPDMNGCRKKRCMCVFFRALEGVVGTNSVSVYVFFDLAIS